MTGGHRPRAGAQAHAQVSADSFESTAPHTPRRLGEPIDRLFAAYAILSMAALAFPSRPAAWPVLAVLHIAAAVMGFGVPPVARAWDAFAQRWPRTARIIGDWYALILIPSLYAEVAVLNRSMHGGRYFDATVLGWEGTVFGGQPSQAWADAMPNLFLSEILHAAYLSYYLIIYIPPLILYARGRRAAFRQSVFAIMLTFFVHYVVFIAFPVQGPRYLFPAPDGGAIEGGAFYQLAHLVLEAGSSRGAAFPSSHVGVAVAQTLLVRRYLPSFALPVGIVAVGLALGAVYGGFHYAIDTVVGAAVGVLAVLAAPRLFAALEGNAARSAGESMAEAVHGG